MLHDIDSSREQGGCSCLSPATTAAAQSWNHLLPDLKAFVFANAVRSVIVVGSQLTAVFLNLAPEVASSLRLTINSAKVSHSYLKCTY